MAPEHDFDREDREDAPFLIPDPESQSPSAPVAHHDDSKTSTHYDDQASAQKVGFRLKVILFSMILAVEVGFAFVEGPQVRIFESIACRQYFSVADPSQIGANGQVPEEMCKGADVQAELAAVKGYHMFFDGLLCRIGSIR